MGTLSNFNFQEYVRWFLAGFLIMFAGFKLVAVEVFIKVFPLYDVIAKRFRPYKYIYPLLQAFLGMWYIAGVSPVLRDLITITMGVSSLYGILQIVNKRGAIKLAYMGNFIRLRYSTIVIFENATMVILGIIALVGGILFK